MDQRSIDAYDLPLRVLSYDADMEVMHPNRGKMVRVALEFLPFPKDYRLRALDLGIGTGYFTERFLNDYPNGHVVAVDGAKAMLDLARARLGGLGEKVDFLLGDFRRLDEVGVRTDGFDVVYSSYALHHLKREEKRSVVAQAVKLLQPNGWFLNADLIAADSQQVERRIQQLRVQGIIERAVSGDARFLDATTTRRFLDELEQADGDQPQTLMEDLQILRDAGIRDASVLWLEHREAVLAGCK